MTGEEDAQKRRIREGRVRKGKTAMTNRARKEMEAEYPYVPKTRRRRDLRIGGEGGQVHSHRWITPPRWLILIRHRCMIMPGMRTRVLLE